jgi:hypothetical protein
VTAAVGGRFTVRVTVTDAWDQVTLAAGPSTTVAEVKRRGLAEALGGRVVDQDAYVVKVGGAEVFDEETTLLALGVPDNAALIILSRRRRPVR